MSDSAEKQVNDLANFTDMALAFIEAIKNPKAVDNLKKQLVDAVSLSEDKKKEAADAVAAIAESNKVLAQAEKALNDVEISRGFANQQAAIQKQDWQNALKDIDAKNLAFKSQVDERMAVIEKLNAEADARHKDADRRHAEIDARDADLKVRESNINAMAASSAKRLELIAQREADVQAAEDDLAARKKKLIDLASGD